jgi:hypothetical protein
VLVQIEIAIDMDALQIASMLCFYEKNVLSVMKKRLK